MLEVVTRGTAFERGRQYGEAVRDRAQQFVADGLARINLIRHQPLSPGELHRSIDAHRRIIEADVPELAQEVEGFAIGAGLSYEQALLLQLRRELIGAPEGPAGGDCTTIAQRRRDGALLAQTVDQDGLLAELGLVLRVCPANGEAEALLFTFVGLLGYLGLNSHGLGVCINLVTADRSVPGVPPYLLVRALLTCSTAQQAIERLRSLRPASARAFTIVDAKEIICCEFTTQFFRSWRAESVARTNHFLHPDLVAQDRLNVFSRNGSRKRLEIAQRGLSSVGLDPAAAFDLLADHSLFPTGLCAHAEGDLRRPDTVAGVVLQPDSGSLWVCQGHPCTSKAQVFRCSPPPSASRDDKLRPGSEEPTWQEH